MSFTTFRSVIVVILLWQAGLGAAGQFAKFVVPFSFLQTQYPSSGAELGWLLTIISAFGAVFGMTAGVLVTSLGFGRVLIWALILGGGISLWQATLPDMSMMITSRFLEGISHLAIVVAAPTLMVQFSSNAYKGVVMTLWSTFFGVSFALTAWLGLPMVKLHGLEALFTTHGIFMLLLAVVLLLVLKDTDSFKPITLKTANIKAVLHQHVRAYGSPFVAAPSIGWLFYTMTFVALLAILPNQLTGNTKIVVAGFMPLVSIATALILVSGLLLLMSPTKITILGFGLSGVCALLFFTGLSLPILCVSLFAMLGLIQGASFAAIPELNRSAETQALAYGAMAQLGNVGNLIGTPFLLAVLACSNLSIILITVSVLYLLGGLSHLYLAGRRNAQTMGKLYFGAESND